MIDPRIYRLFLGLVLFAVIVFGFSLQDQRGAMTTITTTAAPGQYFTSLPGSTEQLAARFPGRSPGSAADSNLAAYVRSRFAREQGFTVRDEYFSARTVAGTQTLQNVVASRAGLNSGQVVIVSDRDAPSPAATALTLELATALSNETLGRTVTLISTSGEIGAAGATQLAHDLSGQPIDAVIMLGDLTSVRYREPVIVPWSNGDVLAPTQLRNTLSHYLATVAGIRNRPTVLAGQVARLAFPFTLTQQGPLNGAGVPAVLLSLSGDRVPASGVRSRGASLSELAAARLPQLGTAVLQAVNALDSGGTVAAPSAYLVISGKVVPLWAVRLLILALILPVVATTIDAVARTRRRGHSVLRWVVWALVGAVPFLVALVAAWLARISGLLHAVPPGAVGGGAIPIGGSGAAVMVGLVLLVALSFVFLRPLCLRVAASLMSGARRPQGPGADAAAVAVSAVMSTTVLVIWLLNPFSAALLVPALHLWMWMAAPSVRTRRWAVLLLALIAILPAIGVIVFYGMLYGLTPLGLAWSGTLMVAGGAMPAIAAFYWSVTLGCLVSVVLIGVRSARAAASAPEPNVTVRGPSSYAGPGSLGGTESALRR